MDQLICGGEEMPEGVDLGPVPTEPILFAISVYGDKYIPFVQALLQSIDETYEGDFEALVYHGDTCYNPRNQKEWGVPSYLSFPQTLTRLVPLNISLVSRVENVIACCARMWADMAAEIADRRVVFIDADTLVLRRFDDLFDRVPFDIGFAYKTERDETTYWPINCGVMLAKNSDRVRTYLKSVADGVDNLIAESDGAVDIGLWGGVVQTVFGEKLGTRDAMEYGAGLDIDGVRLQGFPCKTINECRRAPNITPETRVFHYKGRWQMILPDGNWDKSITEEKGGPLFRLWRGYYEQWQARSHVGPEQQEPLTP